MRESDKHSEKAYANSYSETSELCCCLHFNTASCLSHVCMKVSVVAIGRGHCKTPGERFEAQDSHIPSTVSQKHKQDRVYTHTASHSKRDVAHM